MKKYIGNVSDFNGGVVRMLDSNKLLQPHYLGGANSQGDITYLSYEVSEVNPNFLKKNDLRFLTDDEVAHFFRGENMKGDKIAKPSYPKITEKDRLDMVRIVKEAIEDRESKGESVDFLYEILDKLV